MIENLVYLRYVIIFAACFLVVQYIGWIYWRLGMARRTVETDPEVMVQPRKKGEPVDPNSPQVVSYIFTEDPLFHLFVGVPFIFGLGLLAIQPFGGLVLVAYAALAFFFLITGLILIHEFGHFIAARKLGVVVEEFGFGLPPRAKRFFTWQGTEFTLNWIPFGGFVRLKGENDGEEGGRKSKGSSAHAAIWKRCIILIAGVTMNFLLAMLIFLFGFSYGQWIPTYLTLDEMEHAASTGEIHLKLGVLIDDVLAGGGAEDAKISKGSVLVSIDGKAVMHPSDVVANRTPPSVAKT